MTRSATVGPSLIIEGMRILWRRDIRWLVLIPLLVNIILFISVAGFAASWLQNWITTISTSVPEWLQWFAWVIWFLFALLALAIYAFTFTILANLIGSPFYGVIAQRVIAAEIANDLSEQGPSLMSLEQWQTIPIVLENNRNITSFRCSFLGFRG